MSEENKFIIPQDASGINRQSVQAGDMLMVMRAGFPPFKILVTQTGFLQMTFIGEPDLSVVEGDRKIIGSREYIYTNSGWVLLSSGIFSTSFNGNGGTDFVFNGGADVYDPDFTMNGNM